MVDKYRIEDEVSQILEQYPDVGNYQQVVRQVRDVIETVNDQWPVPHAGDADERRFELRWRARLTDTLVEQMISNWQVHADSVRLRHQEACDPCLGRARRLSRYNPGRMNYFLGEVPDTDAEETKGGRDSGSDDQKKPKQKNKVDRRHAPRNSKGRDRGNRQNRRKNSRKKRKDR